MVLNPGRAASVMEERGLEAVIAASPTNVTYLADFSGVLHFELREQIFAVASRRRPEEVVLVLPMGQARDLINDNEARVRPARRMVPYGTYVIYSRGREGLDRPESITRTMIGRTKVSDPVAALSSGLREAGVERGRVAVDDEVVPMSDFRSLSRRLGRAAPGVELVRGSQVFRDIRAVKTREEVERLSKAASISESAFEAAMSHAGVGARGPQLTYLMICHAVRRGCTMKTPLYPTLSFGRKSYLQNATHPALETLRRGDLVRFDGGFPFGYYSADIARNAVVGRPSRQQRQLYEAVKSGEQAIIDEAFPGVRASDLYRISIEAVRRSGIPDFQRAHCGHTIGIDTYDGVMISPRDHTVIEEGMVLNPETPYDQFGLGKFHVEDPILVTKRGAKLLTRGHRDLLEL